MQFQKDMEATLRVLRVCIRAPLSQWDGEYHYMGGVRVLWYAL